MAKPVHLTTRTAGFSFTSISRSRIGAKPIKCPAQVTFSLDPYTPTQSFPDCNTMITVKGPKGQLSMPIKPYVSITLPSITSNTTKQTDFADDDNLYDNLKSKSANALLTVAVDTYTDKRQRAMWGTTRNLIQNMVIGVTDGYMIPVRLVGVGYRAQLDAVTAGKSSPSQNRAPSAPEDGNQLVVRLGYPHPVIFHVNDTVQVSVPAPQRIILQGIDLHAVTAFAANIRKWRKPEPYNQKGVFVGDETIKKKDGKKR
ncbi:hypothetical protein BATDEDRAFT_91094 [Batrachochytrium dendrobatidis JAM81]|uniref:Large ribosomal subunit protein uL6m n=1 Tax=Batrachochytrium dendrobatidis (strain JAM81 / FGSC 10211) TaxID=684364 RepID=F4PA57_BATDJ|nr:mitochondrial 54S ribosomal protein YmL16 [Batrachochytrium dendrobatidis JAM81]EGF77979.1 hypothetical protein BATDEDRAFT_91094 [Batrachochytrium dendrobatidis JAM81]KAK5670375.1 54S ribosomal protein L6 mitochondrial [Batrachochytrium dendrobatidis]|eukprot:XP_006681535.1 hypothetical protein BATDEDRAFT_91094 [Batrachochytrium dendrobatidis JAM81]